MVSKKKPISIKRELWTTKIQLRKSRKLAIKHEGEIRFLKKQLEGIRNQIDRLFEKGSNHRMKRLPIPKKNGRT